MELRIYFYENLLSLKSDLFTKFLFYENLEPYGIGLTETLNKSSEGYIVNVGSNNFGLDKLSCYVPAGSISKINICYMIRYKID